MPFNKIQINRVENTTTTLLICCNSKIRTVFEYIFKPLNRTENQEV
ncbi:hypothetical protein SAMN05216357_107158 [Porphyromonadaceae bacterium KH3CP3RA]|nr:hypothetical protein SAMN05216357_107158 [Porphyromonadaceae bacterium KH3CP3RA]